MNGLLEMERTLGTKQNAMAATKKPYVTQCFSNWNYVYIFRWVLRPDRTSLSVKDYRKTQIFLKQNWCFFTEGLAGD
jgi:hypothetical protein